MNMKKQLMCLTMALSMMATMGSTVLASNDTIESNDKVAMTTSVSTFDVGVEQTFFVEDGTQIKYYLDENLMPYTVENGNHTQIALPLEHLKVTDATLLSSLKSEYSKNDLSEQSSLATRDICYSGDVKSGQPYVLTQPLRTNGARIVTIKLNNIMDVMTCNFDINLFFSSDNGASWYFINTSRQSGNVYNSISDGVNLGFYSDTNTIMYSITSINRTPSYKYEITLS